MLSKKMTVSLMSLITILALAFAVTPAMAGLFSVSLDGVEDASSDTTPKALSVDVSHKGELQVSRDDVLVIDTTDTPLSFVNVRVTYGKAVALAKGAVTVSGYDKDGNYLTDVFIDEDFTSDAARTHTIPIFLGFGADEDAVRAAAAMVYKVQIKIADKISSADPNDDDASDDNKSAGLDKSFFILGPNPGVPADGGTDTKGPDVLKIALVGEPFTTITTASFQTHILLSEEPKGGFNKDLIDPGESTIASVTKLASPADTMTAVNMGLMGRTADEFGTGNETAMEIASWRDMKLHLYLVTFNAKPAEKTVNIKVTNFLSKETPSGAQTQATYVQASAADLVAGRDILTVKTKTDPGNVPKPAGNEKVLAKDHFIPGDGYVVVTKNIVGSEIVDQAGEPKPHERTPGALKYNVQQVDIPNLETHLVNGGVIDVKSPIPLVITEVMWGSDASLAPDVGNSQWIELYNAGGQHKIAENTIYLVFYAPSETPPAKNADGTLPAGITDRISLSNIAGKGQSGRTGHGEVKADALTAVVPIQPIISMYRVTAATGGWSDGQMADSWMQSTPPNLNFDANQPGHRVGTPGAATDMTALEAARAAAAKAEADAAAAAAAAAADMSVMVPAVGAIYVSEVMFAGGGTLPQWIEISNGSRTEEVNLSGWTLTVNNAVADADVSVGASIMFTIPEGTKIMPSAQNDSPSTLLVVTEIGRNNVPAASGQVLNLWQAGQTELILAGVTKRRYSLLSDMAFEIVLAPPAPKATVVAATATAAQKAAAKASDLKAMAAHTAATDMAGNLGADGAATWALPMSDEGGRSSIIRRHIPVSIGPAEPEDGAMMESWALASDTSFAQATHVRASSYYGAMNDVGTPGFRAGGALPVELSHFRPVRNAETGQVVITWSTQSELNNAGFFIKRSQQRDGQFQVINATMVAGAGTTSEKQFYTYTDSTAQPNVVYYYQIEDVSLDGNRQTLTNGTRLRGHIGAAGKLTATWGELKTSNE